MSSDATTQPNLHTEADTLFSDRLAKAAQRRQHTTEVRAELDQRRTAGKAARHEQRMTQTELLDSLVHYSLRRATQGLAVIDLCDDLGEPAAAIRDSLRRLAAAGRVAQHRQVWQAATTSTRATVTPDQTSTAPATP